MNKTELVDAIAGKTDVSKKDVGDVLDAFFEVASDVVGKGDEKITLPGFLSIERRPTPARKGISPGNGQPYEVAAGFTAKIAAGSKLKAAAK